MPHTFHLIANAHLDPVWLWDWREGLTEGIITCRTILDLMDEDGELTFTRGEAAIYQHIERHDPATFRRIARYVEQGRWDVVGGTMVQPDTNLPGTETMARHFARGQQYFISRFGRPVRVAWAADSFGLSGGLPEILAAAGIEGFAFTRPGRRLVPIAKPAFWWEGTGGSRVLAYRPAVGWYGTERDEVPRRFDAYLDEARKGDIENVGCFFGLGNHGGGPTRRQVAEIRKWAEAHPEVKVVFSGLHRLFDALREEVKRKGEDWLPTHSGEMNFCLRGCYSSVAKFKFTYRRAEALVARAEQTDAAISAALKQPSADLGKAWDAVLFNSFHDILPGSSIERAYDDQIAWLGGALHESQAVELAALNALALKADTSVTPPIGDMPSAVAALVWNPHPHPYDGHVELEASLDYRPIWPYRNKVNDLPLRVLGPNRKPLPFQVVPTEHSSMPNLPWRKRVVVPLKLPAMGWNVLEFGWVEGHEPPAASGPPVTAPQHGVIDSGLYRVEAAVGDAGVRIFRDGKSVFSGDGLSAVVFDDPWGSWGGMGEEPESIHLTNVRERWRVTAVETLERGPERAVLWVRLAGQRSRLDLSFSLCRNRSAVDAQARLLWDERSARLKLILPAGDRAEFDVMGGRVERGPSGEVPGGRWVRVLGPNGSFGFASDALYNFDGRDGEFRATVVRATRYANDVRTEAGAELWRPAVDCGELKFRFLMNDGDESLLRLARELEQPPMVLVVHAKKGALPRAGSLLSLRPESVQLLALKRAANGKGFVLRVQERSGKAARPQLTWLGRKVPLGRVEGGRIACWRIERARAGWKATSTNVWEKESK